jgi:hypothetical protein
MFCPPAAVRSLHPEIGDDGDAEEKRETLMKIMACMEYLLS